MNATSSSDEFLSNQLKSYFNQDFNESLADDGKMMSVQDMHALKIFEASAHLVNSHYQIAIPWKQGQQCMPNNGRLAEPRLAHLKRRLILDPALKQRYANLLMISLIRDMHAEFLTSFLVATMKMHGNFHTTT